MTNSNLPVIELEEFSDGVWRERKDRCVFAEERKSDFSLGSSFYGGGLPPLPSRISEEYLQKSSGS